MYRAALVVLASSRIRNLFQLAGGYESPRTITRGCVDRPGAAPCLQHIRERGKAGKCGTRTQEGGARVDSCRRLQLRRGDRHAEQGPRCGGEEACIWRQAPKYVRVLRVALVNTE